VTIDAKEAKELVVRPIGFVKSPFKEKAEAPRQAVLARARTHENESDGSATIHLNVAYRDALDDLAGFDRIWVIFWFDQAEGWRPKVLPPRSEEKRGVFATRSPHRPNPIGMSAVRLNRVDTDACILHVSEIDLIDGTPVLDIKPYIPYADAFPDAAQGWLVQQDARLAWAVSFEGIAEEACAWIVKESAFELRERIASALALGPQPHAYRRIKETPGGPGGPDTRRILAVKEWRAVFRHDEVTRAIVVEKITTGYRDRDLHEGTDTVHDLHRRFTAHFP
jgi:tRNA-Thr(GGU) m(6)t(6)A37 methyltransferase TsaA